jgi:hypothetical protein
MLSELDAQNEIKHMFFCSISRAALNDMGLLGLCYNFATITLSKYMNINDNAKDNNIHQIFQAYN